MNEKKRKKESNNLTGNEGSAGNLPKIAPLPTSDKYNIISSIYIRRQAPPIIFLPKFAKIVPTTTRATCGPWAACSTN